MTQGKIIVKPHPVYVAPGWPEIRAEAARRGVSEDEALKRLLEWRTRQIEAEESDPLRYGWEPQMWKVADALLGFECQDRNFERRIKERYGWSWDTWSGKLREIFGFLRSVVMLLILGGNRSSKSEYAAKRAQQLLSSKPNMRAHAFHMSEKRSVHDQQTLFWKYMPPEFQVQQTGVREYIKYKQKTGFAEGSFINPIGSECVFGAYTQDRDTALEGLEDNLVVPDELIPPDWVATLIYRLATRGGKGIITFTPKNGYSPTVKMFLDGAVMVRHSPAYLLPTDILAGEPSVARALGLNEAEGMVVLSDNKEKHLCVPISRPEDVLDWVEGLQKPEDKDPKFEAMPRVMRSHNPQFGVIFFHAADNPYGGPQNVMLSALGKHSRPEIRVRVYGLAEKTMTAVFPLFRKSRHVIPDAAIPKGIARYMLVDPAGDRNWFMGWILATAEADYVYREWPGSYVIPEIGLPGPWAIPSGRKEGRNDGDRGEGQQSFGWGLMRYKFEIARLERWEAYERWWVDSGGRIPIPDLDIIAEWEEGSEYEPITGRMVDSRAASNPRLENDRPVTLYEDLRDAGMDFSLAPGGLVNDGIIRINSALYHDKESSEEDGVASARPLFIAESCQNMIFSLETWMNVEGDKGPSKDPIDLLRWYYTSEDTGYQAQWAYAARGGFAYGRGTPSVQMHVEAQRPRPRPKHAAILDHRAVWRR